jgi:hypothetical protein
MSDFLDAKMGHRARLFNWLSSSPSVVSRPQLDLPTAVRTDDDSLSSRHDRGA